MKRILMLVAVCAAVTSAFAATKTTWTDKAGDHRWANPDNWTAGVPDASVSQPAEIGLGDHEIVIDGEYQFYSINLVASQTANAGTVTLRGAGRLYTEGSGSSRKFTIGRGRKFVLDGPSFYVWNYDEQGDVTVKSGVFNVPGKGLDIDDGSVFEVLGGELNGIDRAISLTNKVASLIVKGGLVQVETLRLQNQGVFRVDGGRVVFNDLGKVSLGASAVFRHMGGTISVPTTGGTGRIWKEQMNKDAVLELRSEADTAAYFQMTTTNFYEMAGTLVATNGGVTVKFQNQSYVPITFSGHGFVVANKLSHNAQKSNAGLTFDLSSLTLGAGGIVAVDGAHNDDLYFQNGITFGAYGDWKQTDYAAKPTDIFLSGPVAFNTRDAFDGVTSRTMELENVDLSGVTSLMVAGGGIVKLDVKTEAERLRALTLSDSSTLSFQTNRSYLCADTVTVGGGSKLTITPDKGGYLDVSASASIPEGGVKLEFADPAFTAARTPVYFAPVGTDPDLSIFDTTDVPVGLTLAKRDNVVYLTDGSPDTNDTTGAAGTTYYWSGAVSDDFKTAGNWVDAVAVGTSANGVRHFNGWTNMTVHSDSASLRPTKIIIDAGCGPFRMTGSGVRPSDEGNSLATYSAYPVVFDLPIGKANGAAIQVMSYGTGYLALVGGADLTTKNANTNKMTFVGDVRLGGAWRYRALAVAVPKGETVERPHRLTLLPGATLTLDGGGTFEETLDGDATYDVTAGATFVVQNTPSFTLAFAATHFVDGTWTVNCPFKATSRQTFRGSGTLKLASLAAAAGGIEIADSMTLVPGDWDAATEVFFRETPTVKTGAAATIGAAVTFELEPHATLTVDTTDGDLTMETPILGGGDVVKAGSGKLILDTADCVIDTLTIAAGEVTPSARLVAEADAGYVPFLTVRKLVGELTVKDAKIRATLNADGTTTYSFKNRHGMALIVR